MTAYVLCGSGEVSERGFTKGSIGVAFFGSHGGTGTALPSLRDAGSDSGRPPPRPILATAAAFGAV